jgi:hypothetical protein
MSGNVTVYNTPGLYSLTTQIAVPTSAQQLLNLLSNNGNVDFSLTTGNSQVQANAVGLDGAQALLVPLAHKDLQATLVPQAQSVLLV